MHFGLTDELKLAALRRQGRLLAAGPRACGGGPPTGRQHPATGVPHAQAVACMVPHPVPVLHALHKLVHWSGHSACRLYHGW